MTTLRPHHRAKSRITGVCGRVVHIAEEHAWIVDEQGMNHVFPLVDLVHHERVMILYEKGMVTLYVDQGPVSDPVPIGDDLEGMVEAAATNMARSLKVEIVRTYR